MLNITKTTKITALAFMLVFTIPSMVSASKDTSWGGSLSDYGWSDWSSPSTGGYSYDSYSYDYTPSYSYGSDYGYDAGYGYGGDYGYTAPSYFGSSLGGYDYFVPPYSYAAPAFTGSSFLGGNYTPPSTSYSSASANPIVTSNSSVVSDTRVTSTNTNNNSATGGNAVNNNVNNVYVYTNPTGTAVLNNPAYQRLDGYCIITPNNPRTGQTVTATAYMTGGIGEYTYVWGGDLNSSATGVSTSFTSYNAGTKNITVTARSGQDVKTVNCTVTFQNNTFVNGISSGTSVSGVYVQPAYINPGRPVSGVYLNDLPATGISLTWMHYMIATMVLILAGVATYIGKNKARFTGVVDSE